MLASLTAEEEVCARRTELEPIRLALILGSMVATLSPESNTTIENRLLLQYDRNEVKKEGLSIERDLFWHPSWSDNGLSGVHV